MHGLLKCFSGNCTENGHKCTTVQSTFIEKTFGDAIGSYAALGALETQRQGY